MSTTITIRLTPERERLLKLFKQQYNIDKNSEAFEFALKLGFDKNLDYKSKIEKVAGCLTRNGDKNATEIVRSLRDR
ncbi:hypothetical protein KKA14_06610 [bacterium]|nr:hypothetical protein [bacterium]